MKSSNTGYTVLCLFPIFYFIVHSDFSVRQCNPFALENEYWKLIWDLLTLTLLSFYFQEIGKDQNENIT